MGISVWQKCWHHYHCTGPRVVCAAVLVLACTTRHLILPLHCAAQINTPRPGCSVQSGYSQHSTQLYSEPHNCLTTVSVCLKWELCIYSPPVSGCTSQNNTSIPRLSELYKFSPRPGDSPQYIFILQPMLQDHIPASLYCVECVQQRLGRPAQQWLAILFELCIMNNSD